MLKLVSGRTGNKPRTSPNQRQPGHRPRPSPMATQVTDCTSDFPSENRHLLLPFLLADLAATTRGTWLPPRRLHLRRTPK